jgi:hypothetical protein
MVATFAVPGGSANPTIAGISQVSSQTSNSFLTPKTYHLIAPDGHTAKDWRVTVIYGTNTAANILTYTLPGQTGSSVISMPSETVNITVPYGTVLTNLIATFTLSPGANAFVGADHQINGTTINDFRHPVLFNVTASDGIHYLNWTVNVAVTPPSTAAEITAFSLPGVTGARTAIINSAAGTVNISVPTGTSVTMTPTFTVSNGATSAPISGVERDFIIPVTYTVTAQDGIHTKDWVVNVNVGFGTDNIGIYKDGDTWLDVNGNGAWDAGTDKHFAWGGVGYTTISGDWNGDGKSKVGVYKDGDTWLDVNGNGVWDAGTDKHFAWGGAGYNAIAGDWNGDGISEIGIYKDGDTWLDVNGNGVWDAGTDKHFVWGGAGYKALAGIWI